MQLTSNARTRRTSFFLGQQWPTGRLVSVALLLVAFMLSSSCTSSHAVIPTETSAESPEERLYAVMLSTRKHRLAGENPTVGLFVSRNAGRTWDHTGWAQGKTFAVAAAQGGGDTLFTASGNGVMRTTDGGRFWKITTGWRVTEVQDVTLNPARSQQVFAATPYGIFRSDDFGETWVRRNDGLTSTFVAAIRVDRAQPDRVFAGTEDGLFTSSDGGENWRRTEVRLPVRSVRQSSSDPARWILGLQGRGVAITEDGGESWRFAEGEIASHTIYIADFEPTSADIIYAGGWESGVFRSADGGRTWSQFTSGLSGLALNVHGIAISRTDPSHVFAGTMGAGLYESLDAGENWQPVALDVFELGQIWNLQIYGGRP